MEKIEAFLKLYGELDEYLRRTLRQEKDRNSSFAQRIDTLVQKYPVLRQKAAILKDYGDLRNALSHHRGPHGG